MALISTLTDTFSGTALSSKWSASIPPTPGGSTVTVGGGCLNLTQDVKAVSVYSAGPYDFSNSGFYAQAASGKSITSVAVSHGTPADDFIGIGHIGICLADA